MFPHAWWIFVLGCIRETAPIASFSSQQLIVCVCGLGGGEHIRGYSSGKEGTVWVLMSVTKLILLFLGNLSLC